MARKKKTGVPRAIQIHRARGAKCTYRGGRWIIEEPKPKPEPKPKGGGS